MAEGKWEYKGQTIELMASGSFMTKVGGKYITGASLPAVKKSIDKQLVEKAEEVKLNLPVIMLVAKSGNEEAFEIRPAVISGIDRKGLRAEGLSSGKFDRRWEFVVPDSPANEKLLAEYMALDKALKALRGKLTARSVPTHFGGYGRHSKVTYADAVKELQDGYEKAKKGKSDE